jgi:glycosyltransferase involved in cell wall biosynthesis
MNIVLCSDIKVGRNTPLRGGMTVHIYELSRALAKLGNNIIVLQPSELPWKQDIENNLTMIGVPRLIFKGLGMLSYSLTISRELQMFIDRNSVDAIQFHNLTGLMTYLRVKNLPIPVWTKCHGIYDLYIESFKLNGNLKITSFIYNSAVVKNVSKLCYRLSPHIIANSRDTMERLMYSYSISPKKISVIYNGVNHKLFNPKVDGEIIRNKLGIQNLKVILYVGDFSLLKGVYHLILSFKKVVKEMRDACLLMVGGYKENSYIMLRELIKQANLGGHIKVIGFVPYFELPKYYAAADICVIPSLYEAFGNVALEAMASGKPVVASKVGGLKEIVKEKSGILVNPGDVNMLAQSLLYLLRNPEVIFEMGKNAAKYSMEFSWGRTAQETLKIIQWLQKRR